MAAIPSKFPDESYISRVSVTVANTYQPITITHTSAADTNISATEFFRISGGCDSTPDARYWKDANTRKEQRQHMRDLGKPKRKPGKCY